MSEITQHIGNQIRMYRKAQGLTLQQLADMIHKSRASAGTCRTITYYCSKKSILRGKQALFLFL